MSRPFVKIDLHVEAFGDSRDEVFEVDRAEWEAKTPEERVKLAEDLAEGLATNHVAWGWNNTDPDDYASTDSGSNAPGPVVDRASGPLGPIIDPCRGCGDAKADHRDGKCVGDVFCCPCETWMPSDQGGAA